MKRGILSVAALALTIVLPAAAQAQAPMIRPFSFGVSAGAAIPMGDAADGLNTGLAVTGLVDFKAPAMPVSLRGELMLNRFGAKDIDGHSNVIAGIVNVVASMPGSGVIAPYFIGGTGVYNVKATQSFAGADLSTSTTAMGINGGMGLNFRLGVLSTFAEARYHYVFSKNEDKGFDNTQGIPLAFGIRF